MNKDYKVSADWIRFRKHWLGNNPPMDGGFYICGICGRWVRADEVTLDHIDPRRADNIFDLTNIQPAHGYCNYMKGSKRWAPKVSQEAYEFLNYLNNL